MRQYEGLKFTLLRIRLILIYIIILVTLGDPFSPLLFILGLLLSIHGVSIRIWSSGHIRKGKELTTSGPYAYSRNPLYIGSLLIALGFCIASTSPVNSISTTIIWLYFLIGFCLIYAVQISREEDVLSEKFSEDFEKYRKEVPIFFPSISPYSNRSKKKFNFDLFRENHEYRITLLVTIVYLLLILRLVV